MNLLPTKSIRNLNVLKLHFFLANILGVFSESTGVQQSCYLKFYSVFVLMIMLCTSLWSGIYSLIQNLRNSTMTPAVVNFICASNTSMLFVMLLFNSFAKVTNWRNLMENLYQFDRLCKRNKTKSKRKMLTITRFVLIRLTVLFYSVADLIAWEQELKQDVYLYLPLHMSLFYQINIASMLWEFANILKSRYDFLDQYLQKIFKYYSDGVITPERFLNRLDNITSLYKFLYNVVQEITDIFGVTMLLLLLLFGTSLLVDVCWILDWNAEYRKELYFGSFMWLVFLWASIYLIVEKFITSMVMRNHKNCSPITQITKLQYDTCQKHAKTYL